jgi:hypothetical protein
MHQAYDIFEKAFPLLEMSAVYSIEGDDFGYEESPADPNALSSQLFSKVFGPSQAQVKLPVYEKLSQAEEERLGTAGIRKSPVGHLILRGECKVGCAQVRLVYIELRKMNGDVVWSQDCSKIMNGPKKSKPVEPSST